MLKISSEIDSAAVHIGEERTIELMAKAGFDAWDFSMIRMVSYDWSTHTFKESDHPLAGRDYLAYARRLKQIGQDNGIVCNQSHAPFPTAHPAISAYLERAIEATAEAGGTICVIHPDNNKSSEENAEMYHRLLPFAKACGVKIATENMWNWNHETNMAAPAACSDPQSFAAHLNAVSDPRFVACLDIGHAEMKGLNTSAEEMILTLGDKLAALHLHDNDRRHDSHALPLTMDIDFYKVMAALKKINYQGYLTLEANQFLNNNAPYTIAEGLCQMADTAKRLAEMFESA